VVIANNVITGPGLVDGRTYSGGDNRGIDFTDSTEIAVTGNSVRGVGIGIGALHTLLVGDSQTISNNVVSHTRYGISLRPAGDSVVTGNIIRNCVNPIAVSSNTRIPKTAIITGNSAVSCLNPMEIDGMTRSIVRDNIEGNAQRLAGDSWRKYAVGKVDAGSSGCTAPTGCWVVNNQPPVPVQETQAQSLPIGAIGTNAFVEAIRIQTNVPFSGATTVAAEIGVVGEENLFLAAGYDLMAAKSSENFADIIPSRGAKTTGQSTILLTIRATGRSLRYIQSGASLDLWVRWSTLQ
jgi:parallel beta-helix repeat protein